MSAILMLTYSVGPLSVLAEPVEEAIDAVPPPPETPVPDSPNQTVKESVRATPAYERLFFEGLSAVQKGEFSTASDRFTAARREAINVGIRQLPDYSLALVRESKTAFDRSQLEDGRFLLRQARTLSPESASVLSVIASHPNLESSERTSIGMASWRALPADSLALTAWLVNALLVVLSAGTFALLIGAVLLICRHAHLLHERLGSLIPREMRGYGSPPIVLIGLLAPLALGLLGMLGCWSLILGRSVPRCRRVALAAGMVSLLWGLAIPVIATLTSAVSSPAIREISSLNAGSPVRGGGELAIAELSRRPRDPALEIIAGLAYMQQGLRADADREWKVTAEDTRAPEPFRRAAILNRAALAYQDGRHAEALELLKPILAGGEDSFELQYNVSLVHLALLDTGAHRAAYEKLVELDRTRLTELEAAVGESTPPLFVGVGNTALLPLFLRIPNADRLVAERNVARGAQLASTLLRGADSTLLLGFGVVLMVLALIIRGPRVAAAGLHLGSDHGHVRQRGKVGRWLDEPVTIMVLCGVLAAGVIVLFESPVHFLQVYPERFGGVDRVSLLFQCVLSAAIIGMTVVSRKIGDLQRSSS